MTTKSTDAYFDEGNTKRRETHREMCLRGLQREPNGMTYHQLATKIGLKPEQVWKRLSELYAQNLIEIAGTTDTYSRYRLVREPGLPFPVAKKPTLAAWLKEKHREVWNEWDLLQNHNL